MENKNNQKVVSESTESNNKKVVALLVVVFLITAYYRLFLALPLLLLIFFVRKESKIAKVLSALYAIIVTFINISVYAASGYNEQGVFDSSVVPIYIYIGVLIALLVYLTRSFKKVSIKDDSGSIK